MLKFHGRIVGANAVLYSLVVTHPSTSHQLVCVQVCLCVCVLLCPVLIIAAHLSNYKTFLPVPQCGKLYRFEKINLRKFTGVETEPDPRHMGV